MGRRVKDGLDGHLVVTVDGDVIDPRVCLGDVFDKVSRVA